MATRLDTSIISGVRGPAPISLSNIYADAEAIRQNRLRGEQEDEAIRQKQLTNDAYAAATGEDGTVDEGKLVSYMAQNKGGANILAIQKASMGLQKDRAELGDKRASTQKTVQETLYKALDLTGNTIASLASNPNTTDRDVYAAMGNLVNAGAFNAQAQQQGVDADTYARNLLSTMPVGNPQALRGWLIQNGSRVADATERLKLSLPKYDEQDRGGAINEGTIDQMTGQRTAGTSVGKTADPGALLSAETARRGQNMADQRAREANGITQGMRQDQQAQQLRDQDMTKAGQIASFDTMLGTLERLDKHKGLSSSVGLRGKLPTVPGSESANFQAELETFKSQAFIPAVAQLKGMGALSDAEGKKLSAAVGALDPNMGEKAFRESISRIMRDMEAARSRVVASQRPARRATDQPAPAAGGIKFLGFE